MIAVEVSPREPRDLAAALTHWLADPRTQQDFSCATQLDIEEMIRRFLREYRERLLRLVGEVT